MIKFPAAPMFSDDDTSADRAQMAIDSMAKTHLRRNEGVDIPAAIFRSSFSIPAHMQNAGRDISAAKMEEFEARLESIWRMADEQIAGVSVKQAF